MVSAITLFSMVSCKSAEKNTLSVDSNKTQNINITKEDITDYYKASKFDIDSNSVIGFEKDLYVYDFGWYNKLSYSNVKEYNLTDFPKDYSYIKSVSVIDDNIYIYGNERNKDTYVLDIIENNFSQAHTLIENISYSDIKVAPDKTIYAISDSSIERLSTDGKVIASTSPDIFSKYGEEINIYNVHIMSSGILAVKLNFYDNYIICFLNENLELINDIQDNPWTNLFDFSERNNTILLSDIDNGTVYFYSADPNTGNTQLLSSINDFDRIYQGSGEYDYFYAIENTLYGYKVFEESSEYICDNFSHENIELIFCINDEIYYIYNDSNATESFYTFSTDTNQKTEVYTFENAQSIQLEKVLPNGNILALCDNNTDIYELNFIDIKSKTQNSIELRCEEGYALSNITVSDNAILANVFNEENISNQLHLYDSNGQFIMPIELKNNFSIRDMITLKNNNFLVLLFSDDENTAYFYEIDSVSGKTTNIEFDTTQINEEICRLFPGKDIYDFFFMTPDSVYTVKTNENVIEHHKIIDFNNTDLPEEIMIHDFYYADPEHMYLHCDLGIYHMIPSESPSENQINNHQENIIDIACINTEPDDHIINNFEAKFPEYKINKLYFDANDENFKQEWNNILISDDVPDIVIYNDAGESYKLNRDNDKNAFTDIYSLIENDTEISKKDFIINILEAMEHDGHLYQITPNFTLTTILSSKDAPINKNNLSLKDYTNFLSQNTSSAFFVNNRDAIYKTLFKISIFYDYKNGNAFFNNEDFKNLVKISQQYPQEAEITDDFYLYNADIYTFEDENTIRNSYFQGKEIVNLGYPEVSGNGALIHIGTQFSIFSKSDNIDMAWEYIKLHFTEEYFNQMRNYTSPCFSINTNILEKQKEEKMSEYSESNIFGATTNSYNVKNEPINFNVPDEKSINFVMDLIENADTIYTEDYYIDSIFYDEYFQYEAGGQNIDEMAENIQNRVMIYINERN